jgi:hypothetical protein
MSVHNPYFLQKITATVTHKISAAYTQYRGTTFLECLATVSLHQLYHNNDTVLKNSGSIKRRKLHSKRNGQTTHWMNKNQTPLQLYLA